jgi:alkylhydroperoxidase family enzyme
LIVMNHESIPRRTSADTQGDVARVLSKLESSGQDLTVLRILANAPAVFRPYLKFASALIYEGALDPVVREVVILWMAKARPNTYEWAEHDVIGERSGVPRELIEYLETGAPLDDRFTEDARCAVALADELLATGAIAPDNFSAAHDRFGLEALIELLLTISWWGGAVPILLEALDLDLPDNLRE